MWEWLDPRGRCGVREYLRISLICAAIAAPLIALLAIDGVARPVRLAAVSILWLLTAVMWPVAIRRSHDEDYAAREAVWLMGAPTLVLAIWITLPAFDVFPPSWALTLSGVAAWLLSQVGLYSVAHGVDGTSPNRFGPPTRRHGAKADRQRFKPLRETAG
jgi:uncharacterized membrane protein YhaH (DUF805 family)